MKTGNLDTAMHRGRTPCEDGGRIGVMVQQAKAQQGLLAAPRGQGRGLGQILVSETPDRTNPNNALISDLRPPELGRYISGIIAT